MSGIDVPAELAHTAGRDPRWSRFVRGLPAAVDALLAQWGLRTDGAAMHGRTALALPVRDEDDVALVLKVGLVDAESAHEHLTLGAWAGRGAVRLVRADPARGALLLERAGPSSLTSVPVLQACEHVGELYGVLHGPAPRRLPLLSGFVRDWAEALATRSSSLPVPRRLVEQAVSLGRSFARDGATDGVAIHADLHGENVLATRRGEGPAWLAIDPKGVSGDPAYEPAPMLWNRWEEAVATGDVRFAVRRRFHTLVDVAGLDEDRAREWVVVRMVLNALWAVDDAGTQRRALTSTDRDWITTCVTVAKAVQD